MIVFVYECVTSQRSEEELNKIETRFIISTPLFSAPFYTDAYFVKKTNKYLPYTDF